MTIQDRVAAFSQRFDLRAPILLAPMAGVPAPALSAAVMEAGGMGACGVLMMEPKAIVDWCDGVRASTAGPFQLNIWVPDPPPERDPEVEERMKAFLATWGAAPPEVDRTAGPSFEAQCQAMLEAAPAAVSSVMGLFPEPFVRELRARGVAWFAGVSTLGEARAAYQAGADAIVVQGMEAGGHRAAFEPERAEEQMAGLFALLPAVVDAIDAPVIAAGGIADGRGVAAALMLGASAVQIGTGFLRCPEAGIAKAWADSIGQAEPDQTTVSRVFSGRPARSLATAFVRAATAPDAPRPAPYPIQRQLTAGLRQAGIEADDVDRIQAWAGQAGRLSQARPAGEIVREAWLQARQLMGWAGG